MTLCLTFGLLPWTLEDTDLRWYISSQSPSDKLSLWSRIFLYFVCAQMLGLMLGSLLQVSSTSYLFLQPPVYDILPFSTTSASYSGVGANSMGRQFSVPVAVMSRCPVFVATKKLPKMRAAQKKAEHLKCMLKHPAT